MIFSLDAFYDQIYNPARRFEILFSAVGRLIYGFVVDGRYQMQVKFKRLDATLIITIVGRIDFYTSSVLADALRANLKNSVNVIFNFANVDYISSAGIRVMLQTRKHTQALNGTIMIKDANDDVKAVFAITGIARLFNI